MCGEIQEANRRLVCEQVIDDCITELRKCEERNVMAHSRGNLLKLMVLEDGRRRGRKRKRCSDNTENGQDCAWQRPRLSVMEDGDKRREARSVWETDSHVPQRYLRRSTARKCRKQTHIAPTIS
ncbi:hypothetical protein PoB_000904000 [Plakobranchus ocellatus]|uniref:Uncharacterized protein n=1 Tax=Plakobranchus ocellatus TaxID=259542 RepID=A0AAV3YHG9_9GAST|nr:hypothetical protein PoB_000904000 [Plakobranchus ocellatus]